MVLRKNISAESPRSGYAAFGMLAELTSQQVLEITGPIWSSVFDIPKDRLSEVTDGDRAVHCTLHSQSSRDLPVDVHVREVAQKVSAYQERFKGIVRTGAIVDILVRVCGSAFLEPVEFQHDAVRQMAALGVGISICVTAAERWEMLAEKAGLDGS